MLQSASLHFHSWYPILWSISPSLPEALVQALVTALLSFIIPIRRKLGPLCVEKNEIHQVHQVNQARPSFFSNIASEIPKNSTRLLVASPQHSNHGKSLNNPRNFRNGKFKTTGVEPCGE